MKQIFIISKPLNHTNIWSTYYDKKIYFIMIICVWFHDATSGNFFEQMSTFITLISTIKVYMDTIIYE